MWGSLMGDMVDRSDQTSFLGASGYVRSLSIYHIHGHGTLLFPFPSPLLLEAKKPNKTKQKKCDLEPTGRSYQEAVWALKMSTLFKTQNYMKIAGSVEMCQERPGSWHGPQSGHLHPR